MAYARRVQLPPRQSVDASKEIGLKALSSLSMAIAKRAPEKSATVLSAASELLAALPPLRMFKSLVPRCPPEDVLLITEGMVSSFGREFHVPSAATLAMRCDPFLAGDC